MNEESAFRDFGSSIIENAENTTDVLPKNMSEEKDRSLTAVADLDTSQHNECSDSGSIQRTNSRRQIRRTRSASLPSHASFGKSFYSGNSSIQISTVVSMNEEDVSIGNTMTNAGYQSEPDHYVDTKVVIVSDTGHEEENTHEEENIQEKSGEAQQPSCINGALRSTFESFGTSFGSLLGIQTPVKVIDKTPGEDIWEIGESASSNVRALATHPEPLSRKDSVSSRSRANENGSFRSGQTGQTPGNDSSAFSEGTIPFLPELSRGEQKSEKLLQPKPSYRSNPVYDNNNGSRSTRKKPSSALDNETAVVSVAASDVEELIRNGFTVAQPRTSVFEDVQEDLLEKASKSESKGDYGMALEYYGKCLEFFSRLKKTLAFLPKHHASVASLFHNIGVVHWKIGAYDDSLRALNKAKRQIHQAIDLCEDEEVQQNKELLCDILNTVGRIYASKGDFDEALEQHGESLSILKSLFVDKKEHLTQSSAGNDVEDGGALNKIEHEPDEIEKSDGMNHPGIARALICMGTVHVSSGRLPVAMELFKGGLEIQRKVVGSKHVDVAATLNSIGSVYEKTGRHEKAMQCYKKARQIYTKKLGEDHVDVAMTLSNMGQIYHHLGKHQKAMNAYRSSLKIMRRVLGKNHRNVAAIYYNMGLVHVQCCQYETAMKVFKETLLLQREALGDDHVDVALTLESIGGIYEQRLRIDRALELYYKALSIRQKATRDHLFVALAMDRIGNCQMKFNGNVKEAIMCFDEALVLYRANGITENNPLVWEAKKNLAAAAKVLKRKKEEEEDALIGLDITIS
jgi:tetratricopeptide (TPR) repeat protein